MNTRHYLLFLTSLLAFTWTCLASAYRVESGEIEGALFTYAIPEEWNGKLLMIAHGYEPEDFDLNSEFPREGNAYSELLADGWMVAKTSYRRTGLIIEDAIEDLQNLLLHIKKTEGHPAKSILEGESMGGLNSVLMLEKDDPLFDGAVIFGPAIYMDGTQFERELTAIPQRPLLIVANRSEYDRPEIYYQNAKKVSPEAAVALWKIDRDGHVNINQAERLEAIQSLVEWMRGEPIEPFKDATIDVTATESTAIISNGKLIAEVDEVQMQFGNFILNLVESDLEDLGLRLGDYFQMNYGDQTVDVKIGSTYTDVPEGEWVSFKFSNGFYLVCRNYQHAANSLGGIKVGDKVIIKAID